MRLIYDSAKDKGGAETSFTMSATDTVTPSSFSFALDSFPLGAKGIRPDFVAFVFQTTTDMVGAGTLNMQLAQNYNDEARVSIEDSDMRALGQFGDQTSLQSGQGNTVVCTTAGAKTQIIEYARCSSTVSGAGFSGDELLMNLNQTTYTAGVIAVYIRLFTFS